MLVHIMLMFQDAAGAGQSITCIASSCFVEQFIMWAARVSPHTSFSSKRSIWNTSEKDNPGIPIGGLILGQKKAAGMFPGRVNDSRFFLTRIP